MSSPSKGCLVVVVGSSGAGKDSLLRAARDHFQSSQRIRFVKRIITRACNPANEVHDTVTDAEFTKKERAGEFSIAWRANGLSYGLPSSLHKDISNGHVLVANGSRGAIDDFRARFETLKIVSVTVSADELRARLQRRNRETDQAIEARLQRNAALGDLTGDDVVSIDNSLALQNAIDQFIALLHELQQ